MTFETPGYLFLFVAIPLFIYFRHFWARRGGRVVFPFGVWGGSGFHYRSRGTAMLRGIAAMTFWAGICAFVVALMGPVSIVKHRVYLTRGVDIMFALDESPSMFAADLSAGNAADGSSAQDAGQMSRFDAARRVVRDFVSRRENDPVGLVSFARDAVLRVPPTLDYRAFLARLDELQPRTLGNGTAIGMGIAVCVLHLKSSPDPHKVIVLLTDGENNAGDVSPMQAAGLAADFGIRVYTIGIGSTGEAPIRYVDPESGKEYSGVLRGAFDEELLKDIATSTGGMYFNASTRDGLDTVLRTIDSLESVQRRVSVQTTSIPRQSVFIIVGLALFVGAFVLRAGLLREAI